MRLAGQVKAGYYPTPAVVVERVKRMLKFPQEFAALDPCCGEGDALALLLEGTGGRGYGVELDIGRARAARERLYRAVPGAFELAKVPMRAFSLLFLNPPYDWQINAYGARQERKELLFLQDATSRLVDGGVLVYIIPQTSYDFRVCRYLDYKYRDLRLWRFPDPEYAQFRQTVLVGVKKERPSVSEARAKKLEELARTWLPVLPEDSGALYEVPPTFSEVEIRGGALLPEEAEEAVKASPLWQRLDAYFAAFGPQRIEPARPPVPLHAGHIGLLLAAGHLDGVVEAGPDTHLVRGRVEQVEIPLDTGEEDEERTLVTYRVKVGVLTPDGSYREF